MGVLSEITAEYFGDKVREEDMVLKYSRDEKFTPRDLTSKEKAFLNALASYTMYFDKSLFFQIADLQRHTKLVLSRNEGRFMRSEFPERADLGKEIAELEKIIQALSEKLKKEELPEEYYGLLEIWKNQRDKLQDALDNPVESVNPAPSLGLYYNKGRDSKVVLFVDAIDECAKNNSYDPMFLMGQVLLHEYFHSFHFHVGTGIHNPMKCIEEPMAEYGSLVVLDSVAESKSPIAKDAGLALKHVLAFVESKQQCTGLTAAYGFGAYLYKKHKNDYSNLIAKYANLSCLMDNRCNDALEYKYLIYPTYPPSWGENAAYQRLEELLKNVVVRSTSGLYFIRKVFEFLVDNDFLDCLAPFISPHATNNTKNLFSISQAGHFCLRGVLFDGSTPPPAISQGPFTIGGKTYYLSMSPRWSDRNKKTGRYRLIDEFIKMINYVYHGRFNIRETGDEYIMSYEIN